MFRPYIGTYALCAVHDGSLEQAAAKNGVLDLVRHEGKKAAFNTLR